MRFSIVCQLASLALGASSALAAYAGSGGAPLYARDALDGLSARDLDLVDDHLYARDLDLDEGVLFARDLEEALDDALQTLHARGQVISKVREKVAETKTGGKACKHNWEKLTYGKGKRCTKCGKMED